MKYDGKNKFDIGMNFLCPCNIWFIRRYLPIFFSSRISKEPFESIMFMYYIHNFYISAATIKTSFTSKKTSNYKYGLTKLHENIMNEESTSVQCWII